jgi:hypothetical protein
MKSTRGRTRGKLNGNSTNSWLSGFEVGDVGYLEFAISERAKAHSAMSRVSAASRYPASMLGWKFTCSQMTGVSGANHVRLLVRVERTD